jgi:hypothetical protein
MGSPVSVDLNRKMSKIEKALGPKNIGNLEKMLIE